jgi:hypothetical protein
MDASKDVTYSTNVPEQIQNDQEIKISKKEMDLMKSLMEEQKRLIDTELEKKEIDDFDSELTRMLQDESTTARKDPKNMFMMNQKRNQ